MKNKVLKKLCSLLKSWTIIKVPDKLLIAENDIANFSKNLGQLNIVWTLIKLAIQIIIHKNINNLSNTFQIRVTIFYDQLKQIKFKDTCSQ